MWRTGITGVIAALLASAPVIAQTGSIGGRVTTAEDGQPQARVQINVVGTGRGALTRDDGRYTIGNLPPGTYTVRATRIGLIPDSVAGVAVTAGGTSTANFVLRTSAVTLGGVVVVGYGTQVERNRTGAIATVTDSQFNVGRIVSPEQLITAKVPGVQVVDNNEPGGGISIRIRGGSSVTSSNEPLYVVDGVPLAQRRGDEDTRLQNAGGGISAGRNPLNFLNPQDVETVTVLRDASATAIYGSRGGNGVILITTKSSNRGLQVTYSGSVSNSVVTGGPNLLTADQFRAAVQQYAPANLSKLGNGNTDWRSAIQRSAPGQEHGVALSGGRDAMSYRLSLGYLNQQGVVQGTQMKRYATGLNYHDQMLNDRLSVQASIRGSRTDDQFTPGGVLGSATVFAPTSPIYAASGAYWEYTDPLAPDNPLGSLARIFDQGTTYRSLGSLETRYAMPFLAGLSTTLRFGYDVARADSTIFQPSFDRSQSKYSTGGTYFQKSPSMTNTVFDAYLNYNRALADIASTIDVTGGYSAERSRGDYPTTEAKGLSSDLLGPYGIPASKVQRNTQFIDESRLLSYFARVNYALRDRYLLTLSVRRDGSSKFGPDHQWGVFPSAAVGWRIIDEPFMQQRFGWLSDLKLRMSWGVNGNQAFPSYRAYSDYVIGGGQVLQQFGPDFVTTIRPSAVDPSIRWEQTTSNDVGFDYGFIGNRITGTVDYYYKKTKDLIFNVPIAAGTNLSNFVTTNIGSLENRGLELGVNARVVEGRSGAFSWDASFNATTNRNKLLSVNPIGGSEQVLVGGIAGGVGSTIQVLQPGNPLYSFLVYRHKRDAGGKPIYSDKLLDMYVDRNGDGIINQNDLAPYESPAPKWMFGHSSVMSYGNFDGSYSLRAYVGNYVYNNVASNLGFYNNLRGSSPTNLEASVLAYGFEKPQYFSDVYVEDASFLRLDNVTLGYTVRNAPNVKQMRVFGTIQNVFTKTKYTGVDPTAGINGIDNNIYPRSRTFVAGVNVGF